MTFPETVEWVKKMPRGTTIAVCMSVSMALAGWVWAIEEEVHEQETAVAVAVEKAENAEEAAQRVEDKMDKANDKLDALLVAVTKIQAEVDAEAEEENN